MHIQELDLGMFPSDQAILIDVSSSDLHEAVKIYSHLGLISSNVRSLSSKALSWRKIIAILVSKGIWQFPIKQEQESPYLQQCNC